MNGTFTITKTTAAAEIISCLAPFSMSKAVFSELGEPVLYIPTAIYYLCKNGEYTVAFAAVEDGRLLRYLYVSSDYRRQGIASAIVKNVHSDFKGRILNCTATNSAIDFYIKNGWLLKKSFINYHQLTIQL